MPCSVNVFGRLEAGRAKGASKLCVILLDNVLVDGWLSALLEGVEQRSLQEVLDSERSRADLVLTHSKSLSRMNSNAATANQDPVPGSLKPSLRP